MEISEYHRWNEGLSEAGGVAGKGVLGLFVQSDVNGRGSRSGGGWWVRFSEHLLQGKNLVGSFGTGSVETTVLGGAVEGRGGTARVGSAGSDRPPETTVGGAGVYLRLFNTRISYYALPGGWDRRPTARNGR